MKYLAYKYMRSVFAHVSSLEREADLNKMSVQEFIDAVTSLPLIIDNYEEWNKKFEEVKAKYRKETED